MKKTKYVLLLSVLLIAAILLTPAVFAEGSASCTAATHRFVANDPADGYYTCTECGTVAKHVPYGTNLNTAITNAMAADAAPKDKVLYLDSGEYSMSHATITGTVTIIGQSRTGENATTIKGSSGTHMFTIGSASLDSNGSLAYCELNLANVHLDSNRGSRQCINAKYNSVTRLYSVSMANTASGLEILADNGNLANGAVYTGGLTTYIYAYDVYVTTPVQLNAQPTNAYYQKHPTFTTYVKFYYEGGNIADYGVIPQTAVKSGDTLEVNGSIINPAVVSLTCDGVTTKYRSLQYALDALSSTNTPAGDYALTLLDESAGDVSLVQQSGVNVSIYNADGSPMTFPISCTDGSGATTLYSSLQQALDAVAGKSAGSYTITLLDDCAENVMVEQKPGIALTITSSSKTDNLYTGTIDINGNTDNTKTASLTITGITFDGSANIAHTNGICAEKVTTTDPATGTSTTKANTAHNITISNCHFVDDDHWLTAIHLRGALGVSISDCTQVGGFQFFWGESCDQNGYTNTMSDVTVSGVTEGLSTGTSAFAFEDVFISSDTHAIRLDLDTNVGNHTLTNCTLEAKIPVIVRVLGNTTVTITDCDFQVTDGGTFVYGTTGNIPATPDLMAKITVISTDSRYTDAVAEIAGDTDNNYITFNDAINAAQATDTIRLLDAASLTENATLTGVNVDLNGKTLTLAEGTVLTLSGATVENGSVVGEGSVLLASADATLTGDMCLTVTTNVADSKAAYAEGIHLVVADNAAAKIGSTLYTSLADALENAVEDNTVILLANNSEDVTVGKNITLLTGPYATGTVELPVGVTLLSDCGTFTFITADHHTVATTENGGVYTHVSTPDSYTVTLNTNGGTIRSGDIGSYTFGIGATLPTQVSRSGYTFRGWYDNESLTGTAVTEISTSATGEMTFYAKWIVAYVPPTTYTPHLIIEGSGTAAFSTTIPAAGNIVGITTEAADGCTLADISAVDQYGYKVSLTDTGNGRYTFVQPAGEVTVTVTFEALEEPVDMERFEDLDSTEWYYDGIRYCVQNDLMFGTEDTMFEPEAATSRAMLVTILWRLEGCPLSDAAVSFEDLEPDAWYVEAVRWANAEGIIYGYTETEFAPEDELSREQMVAILWRYTQYKGLDTTDTDVEIDIFGDAGSVADYAQPAIQWACSAGLIHGEDEGGILQLNPENNATRAQTASVIYRYMEELL